MKIHFSYNNGHFWIRIGKWGFAAKDIKRHPLLFSQRTFKTGLLIGRIHLSKLKPIEPMNSTTLTVYVGGKVVAESQNATIPLSDPPEKKSKGWDDFIKRLPSWSIPASALFWPDKEVDDLEEKLFK